MKENQLLHYNTFLNKFCSFENINEFTLII